jgi:2-polyprenyl-3-methyl-5-hydroxy-6-metoxy-1,4-benzoquinol methylase
VTIYDRDAMLYDAIYGGDDQDALSFVRWILEDLKLNEKMKILDIGSGTGSLLIPLTKDGYSIEGIEPFDLMIDRARDKAKEAKISINLNRGSFENLKSETKFSLITAINGPLHYVEPENLHDVFLRISNTLLPKGFFLLDLINFFSIIKNYDFPDPVEFDIFDSPATAVIQHFVDLDRDKWINKVILLFKDQEYQRFEDIQEMSMYTMTNLKMIASMVGMRLVQFFSSYQDRPEERKYGGRLILLFQKSN